MSTILYHISYSLWVDHCLARCCWISDHLIWHFIQFVSEPSSCKELLNSWPSGMTFCPESESAMILQGVVEFLTIWHDILSSLWVDHHFARWKLLNFWPSCISFYPVCESAFILQGIVEFLTLLHYIFFSQWVDHCLAMYCWIADHLTSQFIQDVSQPSSNKVLLNSWSCMMLHLVCELLLSCKVLLNFWPSHITFHAVCELTIVLQGMVEYVTIWHDICPVGESIVTLHGVVEFLTIMHHIFLSSWWVNHCLARVVEILTILHHLLSSWWVDHCLTMCFWNF